MQSSIGAIVVVLSFAFGANAAFYEPTDTVKMVHAYPHFDPMTQTASGSTFDGSETDYYMGVSGLPAYIAVVGVIALILLPVLLALRCCCRCLKCAPSHNAELWVDSKGNHHHKKNWIVFGAYYLVCLLALVFAHLQWLASASFSKAITESSGALGDLEDIFQELVDDTVIAQDDTTQALADLSSIEAEDNITGSTVCWNDSAKTPVELLDTALTTLYDYVSLLPGWMSDGQDQIDQGEGYQKSVLFACYAGIVVLIIVYIVLEVCHLKTGLKLIMPISWIIVLVLTVLCSIELYIVMVTCDFCMDPATALLSELDPDSSIYSTVSDYISRDANGDACPSGGATDLKGYVDDAKDKLDDAVTELDSVLATCAANSVSAADRADLTAVRDLLDSASLEAVFTSMAAAVDCSVIHNLWVSILEVAMCEHFSEGMFYFWFSKHITALFLYLLMCLGSVTWQYFGVLSEDEVDRDEDDYNNFVSGGIVVRDDHVANNKKETKVTELTATSRGRLKGLFSAGN